MWKLTIEDDEQKQIALSLAHDDYGIGRAETNAIRLTDRNVSRRHAELKRNGAGWLVRDLDSYNGTYVNGGRVVGEQHVTHADIVQLGDYRLEFVDEAQIAPPAVGAAPTPPPAHQRPDRLVVVVGPQPGQEFSLDREHFTIGRSEEATMSINHSSVSRVHSEIFAVGNGRFEIIDKGSANGIRINGQEVRRGFIEAGDALELGDVRLRFVGAGKIFRAGFDRSQQLPAVPGYEAAIKNGAQQQAASSANILKMVAVGALLGVIGVGVVAVYVVTRPPPPTSASNSAQAVDDPGKKLLEEAKALAASGDLEGAHKKIAEIATTSSALKDPAVNEIEGQWADKVFEEADKEGLDPQKRVEMLWGVATTPTVDDARRRKATEKLKDVGVDVPDDVVELPRGAPLTLPSNWTPKAPTTAPPAGSILKPAGSVDRRPLEQPKAVMGDLMARLPSLNERETKMLIGLCQEAGNQSCMARAAQHLGELKK